jgi:glutamyl-tRNA synthetase
MLTLNRKILHGLAFEAVKDRLPAGADERFWLAIRGNIDLLTEARRWWEVVSGEITPPQLTAEEAALVTAALAVLPADVSGPDAWKSWTMAVAAATGAKGRALYHPLRAALTGEDQGPEMAALLPLIGRERASARLQLALG